MGYTERNRLRQITEFLTAFKDKKIEIFTSKLFIEVVKPKSFFGYTVINLELDLTDEDLKYFTSRFEKEKDILKVNINNEEIEDCQRDIDKLNLKLEKLYKLRAILK